MEMLNFFNLIIDSLLTAILTPFVKLFASADTRFFYLHLISGLLLVWFFQTKMALKNNVWQSLTDKKTWTSRSAQNDYFILFLNPFILFALIKVITDQFSLTTDWIVSFFASLGVTGQASGSPAVLAAIGLTLTLFIAKDFVFFYVHYIAHKIPVIWEFHKIHHSAEVMNFTTSERAHPVELLLFTVFVGATAALINGLFFAFFGDSLSVVTVLGANILVFLQNFIGGALRHSPFPLPFPKTVEKWIVSPAMHHIHHSANQKHWDKNMGKTLAIWDRMFNTHVHSEKGMQLKYGLGSAEHKSYRTLSALYISPFFKAKALLMGTPSITAEPDAQKSQKSALDKIPAPMKDIVYSSIYIGLLAIMIYLGMLLPNMVAQSNGLTPSINHNQSSKLLPKIEQAIQQDMATRKTSVFLEELTFAEVQHLITQGTDSIIIPTGGTEQNGLHMVLGKHNMVVKYTAQQIAKRAKNILVAPVMAYVPEGNIKHKAGHMAFAGTLSLPQNVFEMVLENTALSLKAHGFKTIYLLGDSGGNQVSQQRVAQKLNLAWAKQGVRIVHLNDYYSHNQQQQKLISLGETAQTIGTHAGIRDSSELMFVAPKGIRKNLLAQLNKLSQNAKSIGSTGQPNKASAKLGKQMIELKIKAALAQISREKAKS